MARAAADIQAEIDAVNAKLRKSDGRPGLAQRVDAIKARLEELRAEMAAVPDGN